MDKTSAPVHIVTIKASTTPATITPRHDFVPTPAETSQIGNRKAIRSGRKPLPTPKATAPHKANRFSPFQHRQQQYAVSNENNARLGRSGPSRPECQKTGFTRSRNTAAPPAHRENILFPNRYASGRQSALTIREIAANVRSGSRKTTLTMRPNKTKKG